MQGGGNNAQMNLARKVFILVLILYTPISDPASKGYFDLLIKVLGAYCVYPKGKMSQHFTSLKPGDVVEVKGPIEKLRYSPNMKKEIGMISCFGNDRHYSNIQGVTSGL